MTRILPVVALLLLPTLAVAEGLVTGKVSGVPSRYLDETVVYLKGAPSPPHTPRRVAIDQKGLRFSPHVVAIEVGDTVEFPNHDGVDHNVFSPDNERYNLGMIRPGSAGTYEFRKPGIYTQLCSVHPEMLAYVFVGTNPYQAVVDTRGVYRLDHVPPGTYALALWNSHFDAPDRTVAVRDGKVTEASFSLTR